MGLSQNGQFFEPATLAVLKKGTPFPLDDFPERADAETLLRAFGFGTKSFVDEPELYILVGEKSAA